MKKTKVVCTMGPNTNDKEVLRKLIQNGMDVARFNFSHGDHEEQKFRIYKSHSYKSCGFFYFMP